MLILTLLGRQPKGGHKGRNRKFVTEEEVRQQEEKKQREKEWKVRTLYCAHSLTTLAWFTDDGACMCAA